MQLFLERFAEAVGWALGKIARFVKKFLYFLWQLTVGLLKLYVVLEVVGLVFMIVFIAILVNCVPIPDKKNDDKDVDISQQQNAVVCYVDDDLYACPNYGNIYVPLV